MADAITQSVSFDKHTKISRDLEKKLTPAKVPVNIDFASHDKIFNENQRNSRVLQARAIKKRQIKLDTFNAQENNKTPQLSKEDAEEVFSKLNKNKSKGILGSKARILIAKMKTLQDLRLEENANGQNVDDDDTLIKGFYSKSNSNGSGQQQQNNQNNQNKKNQSLEDGLKEILGESDNPVNRFLILNTALEEAQDENIKAKIQTLFDKNYKQNGEKITTIVNTLNQAVSYGGDNKKQITLFQENYYKMIKNVQKPQDMLDILLNSFDLDEFDKVTNLINAAAVEHQHAVLLPCLHKETIHQLLAFMNNRSLIKSMVETIERAINKTKRLIMPLNNYAKNHPRTPFGEFDSSKDHLIKKNKALTPKNDEDLKGVY